MSTAARAVEIAIGELGVKESPANSNKVKYNTWYYGREVYDGLGGTTYPWCMAFVQWCCRQASPGRAILPIKTASCSTLMRSAKSHGSWHTVDIRPGDVAIYDFSGDGKPEHCGIVESAGDTYITAIEGNTSQKGSQSNGGMVCRKQRPYAQVLGVVRPDYEKEDEVDMTKDEVQAMIDEAMAKAVAAARPPVYAKLDDVPSWYRDAVHKVMNRGALMGTGEAGRIDISEDMCRTLTLLNRIGKLD